MRLRILLSSGLVALAVWALVQAPGPPAGLAAYLPPGPLLVLQARDFGALVRDWNASPEKQAWLKSDNFQVFSNSRLYLRLADAHAEFAAAAGFPADMNLVESVAGTDSALGLYHIGNLEFLYITRLPAARALETALWRSRSSYESRNSAGFSYFIRTDPASRRVAAFAAAKDFLLLATREDLIAGALALLAGRPGAAVTGEHWYAESVRAAKRTGDLRLVMNMPALITSPHFRSYWIQRNVSELRQFGAAISDLERVPGVIREDRVFLRFDAQQTSAVPAGDLGRFALPKVGFHSAWAKPAAAAALDLLQRKVLGPGPAVVPPSLAAPGLEFSEAVGSESDLETRIDEPPLDLAARPAVPEAVRKLIEAAPLEAMWNLGATRDVPGDVFVAIDSAVVLVASSDWDAAAVKAAFAEAPESGPLGRVFAQAAGRVLIVSNSNELAQMLAAAQAPGDPAPRQETYSAVYNQYAEHARFLKMMRLIDHVSSPRTPEQRGGEPRFFSENVGGLGTTLSNMEVASISARDEGSAVFETVIYWLSK